MTNEQNIWLKLLGKWADADMACSIIAANMVRSGTGPKPGISEFLGLSASVSNTTLRRKKQPEPNI